MESVVYNIGKDYTAFIGGRLEEHGPGSGEEFREKFLVPLLKEHEKVTLELDDTMGYGSSFLEEAFGGLVRKGYFTPEYLKQHLKLCTDQTSLAATIWEYIEEAVPE